MTHAVRVVCRPALRDGFALAGVPSVAAGPQEAEAVLADLSADAGIGVVLVEESLYDALSEEARASLERRALPVVIPFPGPRRAEVAPEARLVELLRRAIGYRVRLR